MRKKLLFLALWSAVAVWCAGQAYAQTAAQTPNPNAPEANIRALAGPIPQQVKDTSAEISWDTNSASSTIVKYGTDPNSLTQTAEQPWGATEHHAVLRNLQPNTHYYAAVVTESGRELSPKAQFTTLPAPPAADQFQITHGPVIEKLTDTSVVIAWTTNRPSSSTVRYGTGITNLDKSAQAPWGQKDHRVTVTGLQPNAPYWFMVETGQAQGTGQSLNTFPFWAATLSPGQQAMVFNTK
jgi:phosphodiesterase/alkaline phosphatase D-like protein